jgi:hypothetical protein
MINHGSKYHFYSKIFLLLRGKIAASSRYPNFQKSRNYFTISGHAHSKYDSTKFLNYFRIKFEAIKNIANLRILGLCSTQSL